MLCTLKSIPSGRALFIAFLRSTLVRTKLWIFGCVLPSSLRLSISDFIGGRYHLLFYLFIFECVTCVTWDAIFSFGSTCEFMLAPLSIRTNPRFHSYHSHAPHVSPHDVRVHCPSSSLSLSTFCPKEPTIPTSSKFMSRRLESEDPTESTCNYTFNSEDSQNLQYLYPRRAK